MLVSRRMSAKPVTIGAGDYLAAAKAKMQAGGFRQLPVVEDGDLVGMITERDLRQYTGFLEKTRVNAVMTENVVTVTSHSTLEQAAQLLLRHKIGGLPVVEDKNLVGIITTSDILRAFLDVIGASEEDTSRIDLLLEGEGRDLASASAIVAEQGGQVLGVGTYREKWEENPVCYVRLKAPDSDRIAKILGEKGFTVLGLHP